ncbi:MAG: recombinase family protein [Oscillospiraceae bacterium]|nr:recombinase family protein [Oscillospiraceae bacterium]
MKQSNKQTAISQRDKTIALYLRISRDDKDADESNSITNQKKLLTGIAKKMGFINILYFIDDGITGTKRDRKEFMRMIGELEKGYIGAVMVKDLSRLGRDHIRMDLYIEEFFPENDIRLIAVAEGLDSAEGEDEFTPFRNLMNEWYARDISKKRKLTNVVKGNAGEPLSPPPYGYTKDPDNPKRWIIDPESAAVVRRIFNMTLSGYGTEQIAAALDNDRILTPMYYWQSKGLRRGGLKTAERPSKWNSSTIVKILSLQEYCGDVVNFKTYAKSFKLKKRIANSEENMAIFRNVHEAIVDRADFEKVQAKRGTTRKRKTNNGEKNMFSGIVVCADCGHNLWYHFNQKNHDITYFNCSNYKGNRGNCDSTHYIRVDFLEQVVLGEIRRLVKYAKQHGDAFMQAAIGLSRQAEATERTRKQRELNSMLVRDKELDKLFNRMYEDNISGKIDDERFGRMSKQYTDEQKTLAERIKVYRAELEKQDCKTVTADIFLDILKKYARAKKLTEYMLNELIERVEVFQAEKVDGVWRQRLRIHYNGIGTVAIPDITQIPNCEISMQTRKGVTVTYSSTENADESIRISA